MGGDCLMSTMLKTTRPVMDVRTIDDLVAIESQPYDSLVTARNLYDLFRATTQRVGGSKALTVLRSGDPADVGASFTHAEFLCEVTRAANMFGALGMSQGVGVAAFLTPTFPELPALLLGAQVAGIASSINYLLNRHTIVDLLNAQAATILVIPARRLDEACWLSAEGILGDVPTLSHVIVIGDDTEGVSGFVALSEAMRGRRDGALDFVAPDRGAICALYHTGGTTGRPKLVQLTHGNQIHAAFGFAQLYGYDERDIVINGGPLFHVGGSITAGLAVLAAGGHVIVPSPYALRPKQVVDGHWKIVEAFKVTVVSGVPTSIGALTNSFTDDVDVSSVRMAVTGGAVLPEVVESRFTEKTGIRLIQNYGMTETAAAIAFNPARGTPVAGSVGLRAPFSEMRTVKLGVETLQLCVPDESGLVQVRGPQVFAGYLDPAQNAGTLSDDGWLSTGDVGYLSGEGHLVLTGREKDLIVRGGHNIDPAAIEDVANRFAGVEVSAAVGMPDQYAGEVPMLFVVPAPDVEIDLGGLRSHVDQNVHERAARPRSILIVGELPLTAVGKIFKPRLREMAIMEKVRLDAAEIFGAVTSISVDVHIDDRKRTVVDVRVHGATEEKLSALEAALRPLPQTYIVNR